MRIDIKQPTDISNDDFFLKEHTARELISRLIEEAIAEATIAAPWDEDDDPTGVFCREPSELP
jgi:hypothetical protein